MFNHHIKNNYQSKNFEVYIDANKEELTSNEISKLIKF